MHYEHEHAAGSTRNRTKDTLPIEVLTEDEARHRTSRGVVRCWVEC